MGPNKTLDPKQPFHELSVLSTKVEGRDSRFKAEAFL
jgi:hypothetical protein